MSQAAALQTVPAPEVHRVLRRLECTYTPLRAAWLNRFEIAELRSQRLERRIPVQRY